MLNTKKLLFILSKEERKRGAFLFILILIMAFIDMLGIASIMPFIALLTNPEIINTNEILNFAYKKGSAFGINNEQDFENKDKFKNIIKYQTQCAFFWCKKYKCKINYDSDYFKHQENKRNSCSNSSKIKVI